jgi:hypothetical protein
MTSLEILALVLAFGKKCLYFGFLVILMIWQCFRLTTAMQNSIIWLSIQRFMNKLMEAMHLNFIRYREED